ncbi:Extracellular matrix-binding ebh, putative [Babesia ovata]|uniref:Extracellular matrix-binding ebh, putative n=1 Tax=Babesia ovata TaxID=189622 RepID=A0A2H6KGA5_9APIC|nr:Extracellular matrix-binding ebh, putative [Babesia ovata]GBE62033.1 Extracellular matrix-binding ebh, putative [Babesia ovata]
MRQVSKALEAVVSMDKSLKIDLKKVKDEIKKGITRIIEDLKVLKLDEKVREDLKSLKQKIEGLRSKVDGSTVNNTELVSEHLKLLESAKEPLHTLASKDGDKSIVNLTGELDSKFQREIQQPLSRAVGAVDKAIGALGEKFTISGSKNPGTIHEILGHIHKEVAAIKGEPGSWNVWFLEGGKGVEGIKNSVTNYFDAFSGTTKFEERVSGWTEQTILHYNGLVRKIINMRGPYDEAEKDKFNNVAGEIRKKLLSDADEAGRKVQSVKNGDGGDIAKSIQAVKEGCENFANALDEKLKSGALSASVDQIQKGLQDQHFNYPKCVCVCGAVGCDKCTNCDQFCKKKSFVVAVLCALTSTARQVGNELYSFALNNGKDGSLASMLDNAYKTTTDLDNQLGQATQPVHQGTSNQDSPAGAVDNRLQVVRDEINTRIVNNFNNHVINELQRKVQELPTAVNQFDTEAQEQIKDAAKTAIEKAANQIEMESGSKNQVSVEQNMNTFHGAHQNIVNNLQEDLNKEVNKYIGEDDPPTGGQGVTAEKVKLPEDDDHFKDYKGFVKAEELSKFLKATDLKDIDQAGSLPLVIGDIKSEGLKTLSIIDPNIRGGADKINTTTFDDPFREITEELEAIAGLIDSEQSTTPKPQDEKDGVKDYLKDLSGMLQNHNTVTLKSTLDPKINKDVKGLQAIHDKINNLQKETFNDKPAAIDTAVTAIRKELKDLRGSGLGKIESDLSEEIKRLPQETKNIDDAIKAIVWELARIKVKINHELYPFDVMDHLRRLGKKIGNTQNGYSDNLQQIQKVISELQKGPFSTQPETIGDTNDAIKGELKKLRGVLEGSTGDEDVMLTLKDLMGPGLGDKNTKGVGKTNNIFLTLHSTENSMKESHHPVAEPVKVRVHDAGAIVAFGSFLVTKELLQAFSEIF